MAGTARINPLALVLATAALSLTPWPAGGGEAQAATAQGKIGPWISGGTASASSGLSAFLDACPAAAGWVLTANSYPALLDSFASACSGSMVVLSAGLSDAGPFTTADDAKKAAAATWNAMQSFQTLTIHGPNRFHLLGPGQDRLPSAAASSGTTWQATFWSTLANSVRSAGATLLVPLDGLDGSAVKSIVQQLKGNPSVAYAFSARASAPCVGNASAAMGWKGTASLVPGGQDILLLDVGLGDGAGSEEVALSWLGWFDGELRDEGAVAGALAVESPWLSFEEAGEDLAAMALAKSPSSMADGGLAACQDEADAGDGDEDAGAGEDGGDEPESDGGAVSPGGGSFRETPSTNCASAGGEPCLAALLFALGGAWASLRRRFPKTP